ncbi:unnamed protein product [Adineta ricciae]|uniref:Uncharacterized protein n=1 Tax=Adineta ricciae TaxID=249248 RepID=A0A813ZL58_ADIRI|nr:unnamed protein product [Adineta ricciae]
MGDNHSKCQNRVNVDIIGNGNSAFVLNGVTFNVTNLLETTIIFAIKKYRVEVIAIQLVSFCVILFCVLMIGRYHMSHHWTDEDISQEQHIKQVRCKTTEYKNTDHVADNKHFSELETDIVEYQNHFEKLEHALKELKHILIYDTKNTNELKNSMECIGNMYDVAQISSSMVFFVTMKLIDKESLHHCSEEEYKVCVMVSRSMADNVQYSALYAPLHEVVA